jgi:hypothetical protein
MIASLLIDELLPEEYLDELVFGAIFFEVFDVFCSLDADLEEYLGDATQENNIKRMNK